MIEDILKALPLGIILAFTIGPVFFVLLETSVTKGFKAAIAFDLGVAFGDIVFILIAYFATNQILEKLKDNPGLFIFGGVVMMVYGLITYIKQKKDYEKNKIDEIDREDLAIPKTNYIGLFVKGFVLNFINIGILGFWMGVIIVFGPQLQMETDRLVVFLSSVIVFYLIVDVVKILVAKQLKSKLTYDIIYKIKRMISFVLIFFGFFFVLQGFFPKQVLKVKEQLEQSAQ